MQDMNLKTWGLILVIAIGLSYEAIKRLPTKDTWGMDKLGFSETTPYQVKYKKYPPAPAVIGTQGIAATRVAGSGVNIEALQKFVAANTTHKGEFNHAGKGSEGMPGKDSKAKAKKKKKLGPDEEWEIIVDPTTGKRYRRKKKKAAKVEEVQVEAVAKEEKHDKKTDDDDIAGLLSQAAATGSLPQLKDQADSPYADLEEWQRRLLTRPDMAETRRFIDHYKTSMVSAEIFYKITAMMLEDSRPQMRELGVLCAGLTPSVTSFQILGELLKTERTGSSLQIYTEQFMSRYSDLSNLYVLERVLSAPTSNYLAIIAAKKLDTSVTNHLSPSKNKNTSVSAAARTVHSNSNYFRRFVTILQKLSSNPDASVTEQARVTLAHLKTMLSPTLDPNADPSTAPNVIGSSAPVQASTQP